MWAFYLTNCDTNARSLVNLTHVKRMDHVRLDENRTRTLVVYVDGTSHFVRESLEAIQCALTTGRNHVQEGE